MNSLDLLPKIPSYRLHTYAASFGDDVARDLLRSNMPKGGKLLDPWVGSGTGLIQARILGIDSLGVDIDPIACLITKVATTSYGVDELDELLASVMRRLNTVDLELSTLDYTEESWSAGSCFSLNGFEGALPHTEALCFWFAPVQRAVLAVLVAIAASILNPNHQRIVQLAISSSIIRKWPNTLSQAMDIDHSRPHRVLRATLTAGSQISIFRKVFSEVVRRLKAINLMPSSHRASCQVIEGDTSTVLGEIEANSFDYILTSPPYFNAIDYPRSHKFSQWWLWPSREPIKKQRYLGLSSGGKDDTAVNQCAAIVPGFVEDISLVKEASGAQHKALCKYIVDLDEVVAQLCGLLKEGGKATFVVGNNMIKGHLIPIADILAVLMERNGLAGVKLEPRLIKANRRRYPYGITGFKGLMEAEYLVQAHKP